MQKKNLHLVGAAAALAAVMAIPAVAAADGHEGAKVRVLHGVGDAPAVDVYANGEELIDALAFASITDYAEVPAGTYLIQVVPDGATIEEGPVVIEAELEFGEGTKTTVAATGTLAGEAGIIPQVVADEPMPNAEGVQLRASHFSFDAPAVDIAPVGGDPVLTEVPFGATSEYLDLPAGAIDLEIRGAGSPDAVFTIPTLDLMAGNSYSAYAIGSFEEGTFTVIPAVDDALAALRVGHFSEDAPNVDVYANGGAILEDVPFGTLSDYLYVPAGTYQIQVVPAGASLDEGPVVIDAELDFAAGSNTIVAATNTLEDITPVVVKARPEPKADGAQIRVVHLSADAPKVDIAPDGAKKKDAIFTGIKFGKARPYLDVPAGEYDLEIRPAGKRAAAFDIPAVTLEDGKSYSAIAIGQLTGDSFDVILVEDASA